MQVIEILVQMILWFQWSYKNMKNIFTEHANDTDNPQTYWEHGKFAATNSAILIWYSIQGIIHAIFPFWFPFTTSSSVIRAFKKLVDSRRHIDELNEIMPEEYLLKKHFKKSK